MCQCGQQDLVHMGNRITKSNTYHYTDSTPPSARHHQTTPALPEAEVDGYMLLQEQTSETVHKIISAAWAPQTINASTNRYSENGRNFVVKGVSVPYRQMK